MGNNKFGTICMTVIVFVVIGIMAISKIYVETENIANRKEQLNQIQKEISIEKQRKLDLKEEELYIHSDEFIVNKAREDFGLIQDGEILFIKEEN